jgi:uncharacterized protein YukE
MPLRADGEHAKPAQPTPPPPAQPPERVVPLTTPPSLMEIHPDQVESTAKLFEDSAKDLSELIREGHAKLRMQPMASDEVSRRAADGFTKAAFDGPTSHIGALEAYRQWLQQIADGIRASAVQYRQNEEAAAEGMRGIAGG